MTITYTGNLKLALPTTGTEAGTWGDVVNQQITALLDQSVAGTASLTSMTNADYTLTSGNGSSPNEARYMALLVPSTLTLTAARNIIVPTSSKAYIIRNLTTGGFAVTLKTLAGTGISVPNGKTMILYCDGTNVIDGTDYFTSITVGALTASNGTANGVAYLNGSKVLTTGTALTFDGTNFSTTGTASATKLIPTGGTATGNGMYLPATNAIAWSNNGAETMRLDASGNLGIGTSSPGAKLDVVGAGTLTSGTTYSTVLARQDLTTKRGVFLGYDSSGQVGVIGSDSSGAASALAFWTYNAGAWGERMRLDASGNLGLGVTPSAWGAGYKSLDIGDTASFLNSTGSAFVGNNAYYSSGWKYKTSTAAIGTQLFGANPSGGGGYAWFQAPSGTAGNAITFTQAMTLDANSRLQIGTTSAIGSAGLTVSGGGGYISLNSTTVGFTSIEGWDSGTTKRWRIGQLGFGGADGMAFYTGASDTERARIDANGNLLVGTTTTNPSSGGVSMNLFSGATIINQGHITGTASGTAYNQFLLAGSVIGSITQSGTTAVLYNTTSDQRLKENIQDAAPASALIDSIQVRQFDWKADGSHQRYGFVAQELVTVAPEAVHAPADPNDMMAVDYSKLVPMLVKEIQSLRKRLAALEAK